MDFLGINWLAIGIAALVNMILGYLYFGPPLRKWRTRFFGIKTEQSLWERQHYLTLAAFSIMTSVALWFVVLEFSYAWSLTIPVLWYTFTVLPYLLSATVAGRERDPIGSDLLFYFFSFKMTDAILGFFQ